MNWWLTEVARTAVGGPQRQAGDRVIVMSFCEITHEEAQTHMPSKVVLNEKNEIVERLVMPAWK